MIPKETVLNKIVAKPTSENKPVTLNNKAKISDATKEKAYA